MSFNINALNEAKNSSEKYIDVSVKLKQIINTEEFEDKLQEYLTEAIKNGDPKGILQLAISKSDRSDVSVKFTSRNYNIYYKICEHVPQDNLSNISKACIELLDKLQSLQLKADIKYDYDMGEGCSFTYVVEHSTHYIDFYIYY